MADVNRYSRVPAGSAFNLNHFAVFLAMIIFPVICYFLSDLLVPLLLALFLAYILNPLEEKLERVGVPSFLAVLIVLTGIVLFLLVIINFIDQSIDSFISNKLDFYTSKVISLFESYKPHLNELWVWQQDTELFSRFLTRSYQYAGSLFSTTTSFIFSFFLFTIYLAFLLPALKNFRFKTDQALGKGNAIWVNLINRKFLVQLQKYIYSKTVVSFLIGTLVGLTCALFGVDLPLMWGVFAFLLNFIPTLGSIIASIIPIMIAFLEFNLTLQVVFFALTIVSVQLVVAYIVEPRFFSMNLSLSPIVILISTLFWGSIWGPAGFFLGVPVTAAFVIICQNISFLKPIAVFLQRSSPLREDLEKVMLLTHLCRQCREDSVCAPSPEDVTAVFGSDLPSDYYKKLFLKKRKRILSLEQIFQSKDAYQRVDLYLFSLRFLLNQEKWDKKTKSFLMNLQREAKLCREAVENIHKIILLELGRKQEVTLPVEPKLAGEDPEVLIAYTYRLLGSLNFSKDKMEQARRYYRIALKWYVILNYRQETAECEKMLSRIRKYFRKFI